MVEIRFTPSMIKTMIQAAPDPDLKLIYNEVTEDQRKSIAAMMCVAAALENQYRFLGLHLRNLGFF